MSKLLFHYVLKKAANRLKLGSYSLNGRNFAGRICVFHRGAGLKYQYRVVDFKRRLNLFGVVWKIVSDPNRTATLGLVLYSNGFFSYIILSEGVGPRYELFSGDSLNESLVYNPGYSVQLLYLPTFAKVNNIELLANRGATLCRAAGARALIIVKRKNHVVLKLNSGWLINVPLNCVASFGVSSNRLHQSNKIFKAGKNRGLGWRPHVRGVAMNPCDHPHGGGNGKTSPPNPPVSPWGKMTKGHHTKHKKTDKIKRSLYKQLR